jgi:serine phosphatase RsbU (regulator of sigma subunit)
MAVLDDEPSRSYQRLSVARINGAQVSTSIIPAGRAEGGGDWCEAFALGANLIALSIGDVCGHGMVKHAAMQALRGSIHDALADGATPAAAIEIANDFLRAYDCDENATAIVGIVDMRRRTLRFANAGHPPPLMAGAWGATFLEVPLADVPLGIGARVDATTHVVNIAPTTLVVLYTDGVSEHERDPITGAAELFAATLLAYEVPMTIPAALIEERLVLTDANRDDAAILTLRMPPAPIVRRPYATSPARPGSPAPSAFV